MTRRAAQAGVVEELRSNSNERISHSETLFSYTAFGTLFQPFSDSCVRMSPKRGL